MSSFQFLFFSLFKMNKGKVIAELQHKHYLFSLKICQELKGLQTTAVDRLLCFICSQMAQCGSF